MPAAGDRVLTVPNAVSVVRLLCLPVFVWLLFARHDRVGAALLLAALGTTDWVDGYVARRFAQVSELGKVLDPTADRLLFIVGVGGILIDGAAPAWFGAAVLARELLVGGALVMLTLFGMARFDVTWWGKAGTCGLMISFPLFLLAAGTSGAVHTVARVAAWIVGLPALAASVYAAVDYVPKMRTALRDGRQGRLRQSGP